MQIGPEYGYHPNPPKTWLIVKDESYSQAHLIFQGTGVSITKEGKRHLGTAVGKDTFKTIRQCFLPVLTGQTHSATTSEI